MLKKLKTNHVKRIAVISLISLMALSTACGKKTEETSQSPAPTASAPAESESPAPNPEATETAEATPQDDEGFNENPDPGETSPQFTEPKEGEDIAVLTTNMGVIKIRFFPEYAPLAVNNFITHSKNGYYNNTIFHRVINDFMIQGGDPTGTGTGGESIYNDYFDDEFTGKLHNIRGALSMANQGINSNGSQFFIVQNGKPIEGYMEELKYIRNHMDKVYNTDDGKTFTPRELFPLDIVDEYIANGGAPFLDNKHTVFGHVIEGMDVVDKIAAVETEVSKTAVENTPEGQEIEKAKPVKDVVIEKIEIVPFKK